MRLSGPNSTPMRQRRSSPDPGPLEAEVLGVLWASDVALSPGDVQQALPQQLAYTTVMTTLARLAEKGVVTRQRHGRAYLYRPVEDEAAHLASRMRTLLETGHNHRAVFQRFVDGLSDADGELLASVLRKSTDG